MTSIQEELAKQRQSVKLQNKITENIYNAIQDAVNEGKFTVTNNGYETVMIENPNTKKLSIVVCVEGTEYELRIKPSEDWDNM